MKALYAIILILSFGLILPFNSKNLQVLINQINESYPLCSEICQECNNFLLNCRNLNLTSFKLISNPLAETERIIFTGNSILNINKPIFTKERPNIKSLNLSNNKIISIDQNAFENIPNLSELILDKNSIDFRKQDKMVFLEKVGYNLELLSLRENLIQDESGNSSGVKFNKFINNTNLLSLKYLNLDKNYLNEISSDIFCGIPNLLGLNLESNYLKEIDLNCIDSLIFLNLKSNSFEKIGTNLISKFRSHKKYQPHFKIYLSDNKFKCDCNLYEFYKFIKEESTKPESSRVIRDFANLKCQHADSHHYSINKSIIESNLDKICGYPIITTKDFKTKLDFKSSYLIQNKTNKKQPYETHHHVSKLAVLLFCSLLISATLIFVLKLRFQKLWNVIRFKFYRRLNDENSSDNFYRISFNESEDLEREAEHLDETAVRETKNSRKKNRTRLEFFFNIFRKKRNFNYFRFENQLTDSKTIYQLRNRKSNTGFSLNKSLLKMKSKDEERPSEIDLAPIISDDEERTKNLTTGLGVLGVRII